MSCTMSFRSLELQGFLLARSSRTLALVVDRVGGLTTWMMSLGGFPDGFPAVDLDFV